MIWYWMEYYSEPIFIKKTFPGSGLYCSQCAGFYCQRSDTRVRPPQTVSGCDVQYETERLVVTRFARRPRVASRVMAVLYTAGPATAPPPPDR